MKRISEDLQRQVYLSGIRITGCEVLNMTLLSYNMEMLGQSLSSTLLELVRFSKALEELDHSFVKEIEAIPFVPQGLTAPRKKKPAYIRQQHKLAIRHSNRKRR